MGFGASRLALGRIHGGKAAFFSVTTVVGDKTEEPVVAATSAVTQKLVSALADLNVLAFRGAACFCTC
jgi:hypothetical protein